jgi:hypothetical protein
VRAVASDRRVALVGAVQALFEGAMYVFVLQWPPALKAALGPNVPFGKVFSCFMVCCMIGSSLFGAAIKRVAPEERCGRRRAGGPPPPEPDSPRGPARPVGHHGGAARLRHRRDGCPAAAPARTAASAPLRAVPPFSAAGAATFATGGALAPIVGAFFAFEARAGGEEAAPRRRAARLRVALVLVPSPAQACVGCYFPLIGTLRSKYLPDAYRGVIMNLFGIPLNLIVVAVFLSIGKLGLAGAFACSFSALATALVAQLLLRHTVRHDKAAA